ncbi:hypothetical protein [Pediococcus claussenii]|uniref:hypothetical protein n=1 Tax=Pediococcus claussenii TaxID=187452 RepID=UPI00081A47B4|nr:hypothetical protein [Pediococcus claussenii]ANZ70381.1 hypothetical protein AYR57_08655 [Pediococcus claussenii]ANZ72197.1 hypothetical protein AYR58_08655 [Pediococcus claussenii]
MAKQSKDEVIEDLKFQLKKSDEDKQTYLNAYSTVNSQLQTAKQIISEQAIAKHQLQEQNQQLINQINQTASQQA